MVLYILAVYYVCDNRIGTGLVGGWPGYVYMYVFPLVQRVTRGIYSGLQSGLDSPAAAD